MKGKAEAIGNTVGFMIAKSLYDYASGITDVNDRKILVLQKHLELLASHFIHPSQHPPGQEAIMQSLNLLIHKISNT